MEFPNTVDDEITKDPDRITGLPDSAVSKILSFLPTKYAVRTSSLSTRLKPFRTSLVNLQLDDEFNPHHKWSKGRSDRFKQFVTNVLVFQNPEIIVEKFHLRCTVKRSKGVTPRDIMAWVSEAVNRSVQELYLQILSSVPVTVPQNLFQSTTLVNLNLDSENGDLVVNLDENTKINLPNLKSLELISVTYMDEACVTRLFEGCPELEEVVVERTKWDNIVTCYCISGPKVKKVTVIFTVQHFKEISRECSIQISCPKLEYICIWNDWPFDLSIRYLSGITEAHLCMRPFDNNYAEMLMNMLRGLTSVKYLSLSAFAMEALACLTGDIPPFVLKEDVRLDIGIENKLMLWPSSSQRAAADTHRLLTERRERVLSQVLSQSWWKEPQNRPKWLWEHITELYIFVTGDVFVSDEKLQVLLCVLREVKVLKRVTIQTLRNLSSKTKTEVMKQIGLFSDCNLEFVV